MNMANTYTQLYVQFVFAVKFRISLIQPQWEVRLHKYMSGIIQKCGHKLISINGMPDHIHAFVGLNPVQSISNLMQVTKGETSEWINNNRLAMGYFNWQEGYGAFSYSKSDINRVYQYIMNQKEHHRTQNFIDEYVGLLKEFGIEYDERYIFKEPI